MGGGEAGPPPVTSWRAVAAAAVALWLVPAVLALAVLWLPPLCCAVRFIRVRRKLVLASNWRASRCYCDGGPEEVATVDDAGGGRLRLLHQYLDDQMELGVVGGQDREELEEAGAPVSC